jgi:hypothetical protein
VVLENGSSYLSVVLIIAVVLSTSTYAEEIRRNLGRRI